MRNHTLSVKHIASRVPGRPPLVEGGSQGEGHSIWGRSLIKHLQGFPQGGIKIALSLGDFPNYRGVGRGTMRI